MIEAIFKYNFLQNAILGAFLASIVCGIIGTIIVEKNLVMMSGGIAHTAFGGIGIGYYLGIEPIIGGLVFTVCSALGIASINRHSKSNPDALIGMFWASGMAIGLLFIAISPGYPPDMTSYLFGDILTISVFNLKMIFAITLLVMLSITILYRYWKAYLFDEEFSKVLGINTSYMEYYLFVLISLSIVVLLNLVGIILVIALLTIPPSIAKHFSNRMSHIMLIAILFGWLFSFAGLYISYMMNMPSGASIILLSSAGYFIVAILSKFKIIKNNF